MHRRISIIILLVTLSGCASYQAEFNRLHPHKVAVIVGYDIRATSTSRPLKFAAWTGMETLAILTGASFLQAVTVGMGTDLGSTFIGKKRASEVETGINDLMESRLLCSLRRKGYSVNTIEARPVKFDMWREMTEKNRNELVEKRYELNDEKLARLDADVIVYFEYLMIVYVNEKTDTTDVTGLKIDRAMSAVYGFAKPPGGAEVYHRNNHINPIVALYAMNDGVKGLTDMQYWPAIDSSAHAKECAPIKQVAGH